MYIRTYTPNLTLQFVSKFEEEMRFMSLSQFVVYLKSLTIIRREVCMHEFNIHTVQYGTGVSIIHCTLYLGSLLHWHTLHHQLVQEYLKGVQNRQYRVGNPLGKDFTQLLQTFFEK